MKKRKYINLLDLFKVIHPNFIETKKDGMIILELPENEKSETKTEFYTSQDCKTWTPAKFPTSLQNNNSFPSDKLWLRN